MSTEAPRGFHPLEDLPDLEVDTSARLAQMAFEASYQERLHSFRAGVTSLFLSEGYEDMQNAWMVYDLPEGSEGDLLEGPRTDLLIATLIAPSAKGIMLHVRMMKNELYRVDTGHDCMVTDITVDNDGDALYFIDSFPLRDDVPTRKKGDTEEAVPNVLPMFLVRDGRVNFVTRGENSPQFTPYTPIVDVANVFPDEAESPDGKEVLPFGTFAGLEDKSYALEVASELIERAATLRPAHTSRALED